MEKFLKFFIEMEKGVSVKISCNIPEYLKKLMETFLNTKTEKIFGNCEEMLEVFP